MASDADLAAFGRLLAAPARAAMLDALFDGQAWSVQALAGVARVAHSTASEHLQVLRDGGLVAAARDGRTHRYRLASPEVAGALELLGTLAPVRRTNGLSDGSRVERMREGRFCYDHLAGRLGVAVADGLVARGHVLRADDGFAPTEPGVRAFAAAGIDVEALRRARRPVARACLDWSERRPHLAGALGAALLARLEAVGGVERLAPGRANRALRILPRGAALLAGLGVEVDAARVERAAG